MELSELTLRVLLLFFPGVLCAMLVDSLTVHRGRSPAQFLTSSFVLGMGSYLLLSLARAACDAAADVLGLPPPLPITFFGSLLADGQPIAWGEIALAALAGVVLAAGVSAALHHRLLHRSARALGISMRNGHPDVWSALFNLPEAKWAVARDLVHKKVYSGWVEGFSEAGEKPELLLRNATVHDEVSGVQLYKANVLYLSFETETLAIQVFDHTSDEAREDRSPFPPPGGGEGQPVRVESAPDDAAAGHDHRPERPCPEREASPPPGA